VFIHFIAISLRAIAITVQGRTQQY